MVLKSQELTDSPHAAAAAAELQLLPPPPGDGAGEEPPPPGADGGGGWDLLIMPRMRCGHRGRGWALRVRGRIRGAIARLLVMVVGRRGDERAVGGARRDGAADGAVHARRGVGAGGGPQPALPGPRSMRPCVPSDPRGAGGGEGEPTWLPVRGHLGVSFLASDRSDPRGAAGSERPQVAPNREPEPMCVHELRGPATATAAATAERAEFAAAFAHFAAARWERAERLRWPYAPQGTPVPWGAAPYSKWRGVGKEEVSETSHHHAITTIYAGVWEQAAGAYRLLLRRRPDAQAQRLLRLCNVGGASRAAGGPLAARWRPAGCLWRPAGGPGGPWRPAAVSGGPWRPAAASWRLAGGLWRPTWRSGSLAELLCCAVLCGGDLRTERSHALLLSSFLLATWRQSCWRPASGPLAASWRPAGGPRDHSGGLLAARRAGLAASGGPATLGRP
eukprot:gene8036-biopygen292